MTSAKAAGGGQVINYSDRFTLSAMTGTFAPDILAAIQASPGTKGPVGGAAAPPPPPPAAGAPPGGDAFAVPYNLQTGLTRYAPMQPLPPKTITATNTSPLWPTSSVPVAVTFLPIPTIQTTITQPLTYAFTSHANTVRNYVPLLLYLFVDYCLGCRTIATYRRYGEIPQPLERLIIALHFGVCIIMELRGNHGSKRMASLSTYQIRGYQYGS
jgi:hypothetical protein